MKKIEKIRKSKKAWIRIVEAFIAVLLIMSVLLVILSRQRADAQKNEDAERLLTYTLDYLSNDEASRAAVFTGNNASLLLTIGKIVPNWINYSVNICGMNEICSNPAGYIDKSVYSDERLIVSNLTYYSGNAKKLKVFFWEK